MLPFLKSKKLGTLIIEKRKADGSTESVEEGYEDAPLEACAEDMIRAMHNKDAKALVAAMKAAFQILEMEPHDEYPHEEGME